MAVDGMRELVAAMSTAREELTVAVDPFRTAMRSAGGSTARLAQVDRIADWVDAHLPELQRRLNLAIGLAAGSPADVHVRINEEGLMRTPEKAAEHGRELARTLLDSHSVTPEMLIELRSELTPHVRDPDVMAGLFSALGPDMTEALPRLVIESGAANGREYIALFSRGLGTALSAPYHATGLAPIRHAFTNEADHPGQAWDRLALLQDGDFPPNWLANAARVNALDGLMRGEFEPHVRQVGVAQLRLSGSIDALAFSALRHNPTAARLALDNPTSSITAHVDRIFALDDQLISHPDVAAAFGTAVEAASEVGTAPDDRSVPTGRFTFEFITAAAAHELVPPTMRDSLERIAASYVREFAVGSFADSGSEAVGVEASLTHAPHDFPPDLDLDAAFFLVPHVVETFIGSFLDGGHTESASTFTDAMGREFERQLDGAIVSDQRDGGSRTADVMRLFGGLGHLYYLARRDYAGDLDAQQEQQRSWVSKIFGGALSLPPIRGIGHFLWAAAQGIANHLGSEWTDAAGHEERVVAGRRSAETILWFLVAARMVDHGIGADALPGAPEGLLAADGTLRLIGEIFADGELRRDFYEWVNETPELNDAVDAAHEGWKVGAKRAGAEVTVVRPKT